MSRIEVFPGQGSQYVGMGRELFGSFPELASLADSILGYSVERTCLNDPEGRLGQTAFTQPLLYVVNALTYEARRRESPQKPDFLAGHSLGEYNALLAAEVFDFATGLELVKLRGELMSRVRGGMAAIVGVTAESVKKTLASYAFDTLDVANYNAKLQTVISGPIRDIEDAGIVFEDIPDCRYIPLKVSGPFHSRYMNEVKAEFSRFLKTKEFRPPRIPVIANVNALPYRREQIHSALTEQISQPVRWTETLAFFRQQPSAVFHEVGPGRVLTNLWKAE